MFVQMIRLVAFVFGAVLGAMVADYVQIGRTLGANQSYGLMLLILLGAAVGYLIGGALGRRLERGLAKAEREIHRTRGWELVVGVAGLLVGLVVATLLSQPVRALATPDSRPVVTFVLFLVLGALGVEVAIAKKEDFERLFAPKKDLATGGGQMSAAKILDTSIIVDGRITDLARTHFLEGRYLVPRFVLRELHSIADSEDPLKRNRGRRGLDVLSVLQREAAGDVEIYEVDFPEIADVDSKLVRLASEIDGAIVTNDYNLNKIAGLQGVRVLNINELANALKPVVLPGEEMRVRILKEGKESTQGVGYLDDGTMVVVDGGKPFIGDDVEAVVTSVLQTPAGRMIFTKVRVDEGAGTR